MLSWSISLVFELNPTMVAATHHLFVDLALETSNNGLRGLFYPRTGPTTKQGLCFVIYTFYSQRLSGLRFFHLF